MAFRFLHTADIHLDSPLRGLERYEGAPVERIRFAARRALERIVETAIEESVAFVLVAGDLYDGDWRDYGTGLFLAAQMARLREASIPVYIVTGNHDAASRITRSLRLPDNVHVLSHEAPETRYVDDLGVALHGQGFARPAVTENLARAFPRAVPGLLNIGMLHTSAAGYRGHERYAPCALDELLGKEYDYWALGHIHLRQVLHREPWIVFPGNVQGRHIRETGPKSVTLVSVADGRIESAEAREVDVVRWCRLTVDVGEARSAAEVPERVEAVIRQAWREHAGRPLAVRLVLRGRTGAHRELAAAPERWEQELRAAATRAGEVWVERVAFETSAVAATRAANGGNGRGFADSGALAELVALLEELTEEGDDRQLEAMGGELGTLCRRLPAGLRYDEEGRPLESAAHLRSVLGEVRGLLESRLLVPDARE